MKRIAAAVLAVMLLLCGCGKTPEPEKTPEPTEAQEVISKGDGFVITLGHSSDGTARYDYVITAKDGKKIESASCQEQPRVAQLSEELLGVRFYTDDKSWCRYYDLKNGVASDSFFNAFWDNGTLVAYNDYEKNRALTVRDIFNDGGYRFDLTVESDAASLTVIAAVENEDKTQLTVEYILGDSTSRKTAVLTIG